MPCGTFQVPTLYLVFDLAVSGAVRHVLSVVLLGSRMTSDTTPPPHFSSNNPVGKYTADSDK
jgi:hypothetical protein